MNAALIAICPSTLVEEYLMRVRNLRAYTDLLWSHSFTDEMDREIGKVVSSKGYARLFIYETKKTGGGNIRMVAHIIGMTNIEAQKLQCLVGICKTEFQIVGYEVFEPALELKDFIHFRTKNVIHPRTISGNFGLVEDVEAVGVKLSVLCRLKWNEHGWQDPAGPVFSERALMATEEWNLNTEDSVNGYIYAFFQGRPLGIQEGEPFPLHLWSESPNGDYVLIARYEKAETVTQKELEWVDEYFESNGIYDRRAANVLDTYSALDPSWVSRVKGITKEEKLDFIKSDIRKSMTNTARIIKCPVESVKVFEYPVKFDKYLRERIAEVGGWRYELPCYLRTYPVVLNPQEESDRVASDTNLQDKSERTQRRRGRKGDTALGNGGTRRRQEILSGGEIMMREAKLVARFRTWLRNEKGIPLTESPAEEDFVDVSFVYHDQHFMVEAKHVHDSSAISIRNALGQLLDYNLYPGSSRSDIWLILLNEKPNNDDFLWISILRERFTVDEFPVYLCWEVDQGFETEDKIL